MIPAVNDRFSYQDQQWSQANYGFLPDPGYQVKCPFYACSINLSTHILSTIKMSHAKIRLDLEADPTETILVLAGSEDHSRAPSLRFIPPPP